MIRVFDIIAPASQIFLQLKRRLRDADAYSSALMLNMDVRCLLIQPLFPDVVKPSDEYG